MQHKINYSISRNVVNNLTSEFFHFQWQTMERLFAGAFSLSFLLSFAHLNAKIYHRTLWNMLASKEMRTENNSGEYNELVQSCVIINWSFIFLQLFSHLSRFKVPMKVPMKIWTMRTMVIKRAICSNQIESKDIFNHWFWWLIYQLNLACGTIN